MNNNTHVIPLAYLKHFATCRSEIAIFNSFSVYNKAICNFECPNGKHIAKLNKKFQNQDMSIIQMISDIQLIKACLGID